MKLRVVVDTNVRISSFLTPHGVCARLINALVAHGDLQLMSEPMLAELRRKLLLKFRWPVPRVAPLLESVSAMTALVIPTISIEACRDPDDNRVLECALSGRAHFIITGDQDLLALQPWREIQIVTARQFLDVSPPLPTPPRTIENE